MKRQISYCELEIAVHRFEALHYQVELRFNDPSNEAQMPPERGAASFDSAELLSQHLDPRAYGQCLTRSLFTDQSVSEFYSRVRSSTEAKEHLLRIRLLVAPSALELHALRWELLQDPDSGDPLATSERTLFSRFMVSRDWRPVKLRAKSALEALVAVAAPSGLDRYELAQVDAAGEIARARDSLSGISVQVAGEVEPLTLQRLVAGLRQGVDILYLVCHGALNRQQVPYLFLQDEDGAVARVEGETFARAVAELQYPPRLVVLASCESAGCESALSDATLSEEAVTDDGRSTFQASLAPRLAEAGVPAILAMQGKISMRTVEQAMPVFFREMVQDGQIDRALAVARATVREHTDSWMPALFLRLKRGRIWYVPGFGGEEGVFSKWRSLANSVRQGCFIPILGADIGEHVFGSSGEIAGRLSARHGFPLAVHDRTHLPKVAQYLSVNESRQYARDAVLQQLHRQVVERFPDVPGEAVSLPKLLDEVVERQDDEDPFRLLAQLQGSVYITSSADPMLLKTLKAAGGTPKPLLCDWRPTQDNHPREPSYDEEPTAEQPVVYHAFGVLGKPDSLVLTEDDFFDYLIATAEYKLIPTTVRGALTRSSLIFLGFRLDDLAFRALFRLIMTLGGVHKLREYAHVGVQVDPEDHDLGDLEGAHRYLEGYFAAGTGGEVPPISIYWGKPADFLSELQQQLQTLDTEEVRAVVEEDEDDWLS